MTEELPLLNHWRAGYGTLLKHLRIYSLSIFSLLETKRILGGVYLEWEQLNDVQQERTQLVLDMSLDLMSHQNL